MSLLKQAWLIIFLLSNISFCYGQANALTRIWKPVNVSELSVEALRKSLELDVHHHLAPLKTVEDEPGSRHRFYQQFYKGMEVLGGQVIVHYRNDQPFLISGAVLRLPGDDMSVDHDRHSHHDSELFLLASDLTNDGYTHIVRKSQRGTGQTTQYLDVKSNEPVLQLSNQKHINETGRANTRFNGEVDIHTSRHDDGRYVLRDAKHDFEVITLNAEKLVVDSLIENIDFYRQDGVLADFYDDDNYWDNANAQLDELATDIHWGTGVTIDYFMDHHHRHSVDGQGGDVLNIVHIGDDWDEAFYLPPPHNFMGYGDGGLLATLDVVAHEVTHGVVHFSAGLLYIGESSVLDESLADIFSAAVKFDKELPYLENKWELAEQLGTFRSLEDPKQFGQPDTYLGEHWYYGNDRAIYAHHNNGVSNYWFYLLSDGGSGINDNEQSYEVSAVGVPVAAQIVYRTMTSYLTNFSSLIDFRKGSIQAATDLFGQDSFQKDQVEQAWDAVGVQEVVASVDISSETGQVQIWPNPVSGSFQLVYPARFGDAKVVIYDLGGNLLYESNYRANDQTVAINLSESIFRPGIYLVQVNLNEEVHRLKLLKN